MKVCSFCGAQNLDNSKFCCQCAKSLDQSGTGGKRAFVPMCDDTAETGLKMQSLSKANSGASTPEPKQDDSSGKFSFNNTSTKAEEDDAYAEFKMRDRGDIFNDAESGIFSNDSHDRRAEKKRRKDAEKSIKRADKQKKKTKSSSNDDWQNDDFWN